MPKGVIVLDMPESCAKCPFFQDIYCDMLCKANGRTIDYPYPKDYKQEWCPIRQFPEKDRENYECREAVKKQQECKNCGYKIQSERISKLHDCNDCGRKNNCSIRPAYGKYCRINCHAWTAEDKNGKIDGEKDILLD